LKLRVSIFFSVREKMETPNRKSKDFKRFFFLFFLGFPSNQTGTHTEQKGRKLETLKRRKEKKVPSELVEKAGARERRKVKRTEKRGREAISDHGALCV
jgi:hypothetical protein